MPCPYITAREGGREAHKALLLRVVSTPLTPGMTIIGWDGKAASEPLSLSEGEAG